MRTPRLKIAVFHLGFFYSGGGEKLVLEEVRRLNDLGHEVVCYAPIVDRSRCFPDLIPEVDIRPLLPQPPAWFPAKDALWILLSCLLIPVMAWRFRSYDVLFGANQPGPWYAWVISKMLGKPYVVYLAQPNRLLFPREIDIEVGLRLKEKDAVLELIRDLGRRFISWADQISVSEASSMLTNGSYASGRIRSVYERSNQVCPAGCDPVPDSLLRYDARWAGAVRVNGTTVQKPFILLTNRHFPQKRFEYAIRALPYVLKEAVDFRLVITGEQTRYTDQLRTLVEAEGVSGRVHFVGLVDEKSLAVLYQQAALYVYPSPDEDFGMGIIEAMAAGTPVVAWNHGGPRVSVRDGVTGYLATPGDLPEFSERVVELARDRLLAERMGRAGHQRAKAKFSYERHIQVLQEALVSAVSEQK